MSIRLVCSAIKSHVLRVTPSHNGANSRFLSAKTKYSLENSRLTTDQRNYYEENGFIVIRNLVPKQEINKYIERFKDVANGKIKNLGMVVQKDVSFKDRQRDENTVYKLQELYTDEVLFDYCKFDPILEYASAFCGPDLMAIHTMLINKPPDSGTKSSRHPLHQDLYYFPIRPAEKIVCAWTALEPVNRENGCLVAIPGTHTGELLAHVYPDWEGGVNKMFHGIKDVFKHEAKRSYLEMNGGDTVFFHPNLIHGSGTNRTKGYRKAISCHFAGSDCEYIDVRGTSQESIANEVIEVARKQTGVDIDDYRSVWKYRSQLVKGRQINL